MWSDSRVSYLSTIILSPISLIYCQTLFIFHCLIPYIPDILPDSIYLSLSYPLYPCSNLPIRGQTVVCSIYQPMPNTPIPDLLPDSIYLPLSYPLYPCSNLPICGQTVVCLIYLPLSYPLYP